MVEISSMSYNPLANCMAVAHILLVIVCPIPAGFIWAFNGCYGTPCSCTPSCRDVCDGRASYVGPCYCCSAGGIK